MGIRVRSGLLLLAAALSFVAGPSYAQSGEGSGIEWQEGPATGQLGDIAQIRIPEGYRFAGREGVRRFMELTQNPVSGDELGVMISPSGPERQVWFVIFEFNPIGYVKDDEKGKLDADAISQVAEKPEMNRATRSAGSVDGRRWISSAGAHRLGMTRSRTT